MIGARQDGSRRRIVASVAVGALILSGAAVLGTALAGSRHPSADPNRSAQTPLAGRDGVSTSTPGPSGDAVAALPASDPVALRIPVMGVAGSLLRLDLDRSGKSVQLPGRPGQAGWYDRSATPGSAGTSVIVGYISSAGRPGVFGRLAGLGIGDTVSVARKDGTTAMYTVDNIHGYRPGTLPASVYAATATPSLRLISCGGALRPGRPAENVVVSARLHSTARTRRAD